MGRGRRGERDPGGAFWKAREHPRPCAEEIVDLLFRRSRKHSLRRRAPTGLELAALVDRYNEVEGTLNQEEGRMSDCALVQRPPVALEGGQCVAGGEE